jgi:tRNA-dihydrouridine synthase B
MSGVTDEATRTIAHESGAGLVVSEMVASEELVRQRPDMVRRARGKRKTSPFVIQLAGREAHWMAEGARVAQDLGADIIDINMGCPARQVTGGLSGSALMRNLDHAITLVEATVNASAVPVTLKMRLGWDEHSHNAPELARRAEASGVKLVTVHGRTRCQFYTCKADWRAIRAVKDAITIPLIANGDCVEPSDAKSMMDQSGADGVMIGRGAYGRPWWPGVVANAIDRGQGRAMPSLAEELALSLRHQLETIELYGDRLGNRTFRKHFGWLIEQLAARGLLRSDEALACRAQYLRLDDNTMVRQGMVEVYDRASSAAGKVAA